MKRLLLLTIILLSTSCGLKLSLNRSSSDKNIISGVVSPLSGAISYNRSSLLISTANATTCADPVFAKLFVLKNDGSIDESNPLATQLVNEDARYSFDGTTLNLIKKENVQYVVKIEGCNDDSYKRPVTDFTEEQNVDAKTTIVSEVVNANSLLAITLNHASRADVESLIKSVSGNSISSALTSITTDSAPVTKFTDIFGVSPTVIQDAKPEIKINNPATLINELGVSSFSLQAFHIDPNYSFVYNWKLDNVTKSTTQNFSFIPGANDSGFHTINLYVGKNNGSGLIDTTKPYYVKSFTVVVNNTVLPTAPNFALSAANPSPLTSNSLSVDIATGAAFTNCQSFSHMAITESLTPPGAMQFNIDCMSSGTQTENISITNTDGAKNLYLWAIDNEGNISSPKTLSFVLDTLPPAASLAFVPTVVKGGTTQTVTISASDAGTGLTSLDLYFSETGSNPYTLLSNLSTTATSYNWSVSSAINATAGKLKLVATDNIGLVTTIYSSAFVVDSTAPTSPALTRTSLVNTNSTSVTMTIGSCSDIANILITETNTQPLETASGWQACSTVASATTATVSGNGLHTLYAWAKDQAENVAATANSITMTLDTINPVINSGPSIAAAVATGTTQAITWSVSDTNTVTIKLEYYNGSTWTTISSALTNNGTYSWSTIPSLNINNAKIRLTAIDVAGNSAQTESSNFIIESGAPTLSSFTLTEGAATSTQNVRVNLTAANIVSNITYFCLKFNTTTAPTSGDSCWRAVNATPPGITPAKNITISNYYFSLGFTTGTYTVYGYVRNASGLMSSLTSSGAGTNGTDKATTYFTSPQPPSVQNVIAANTDAPTSPITLSEYNVTAGNPVYIKWKATDGVGFGATPITLEYTNDGYTYTQIATNLLNGANGSCTVNNAGTTLDDNSTGCYRWTGTTVGTFFLVRVRATNTGSVSASAQSTPMNSGNVNFLAGNVDIGIDGSAKSAIISIANGGAIPKVQQFIVMPDGKTVVIDKNFGLALIDPSNGKYTILIKNGSSTTNEGDNGNIALAKVKAPAKIILGYDNNIYFWDETRVRKITTSTSPWTISTAFGGGGTSIGASIVGTSMSLQDATSNVWNFPFMALPNGTILFVRDPLNRLNNATLKPYMYSYSIATGIVTQIGNFSGVGNAVNSSLDLISGGYGLHDGKVGVTFDTISSNITSLTACYNNVLGGCDATRFNPTTLVANPSDPDAYPYNTTLTTLTSPVTGMDGKLYMVDSTGYVKKWDELTGVVSTILGIGTGYCDDGISALACRTSVTDIFIDSSGKYYWMELGMIRTLDSSGLVITLAGQNSFYGDGLSGPNARFGNISGLAIKSTGNVVVLDKMSVRIREFSRSTGQMSLLAGTTRNGVPNTTASAVSQSIAYDQWIESATIGMLSTDEVVYNRGNTIAKISSSTGKWVDLAGNGSTSYMSADGLALGAINLKVNYYPKVIGVNGNVIATALTSYSSGYTDTVIKTYKISDGTQAHLAGIAGSNDTTWPASGATLATSKIAASHYLVPMSYDSTNANWISPVNTNNNFLATLTPGGTTQRFYTDVGTTKIKSLAISRASGHLIIYYCALNGTTNWQLKKWDETTPATSTALSWPSTSISCNDVVYDTSSNKLVFTFTFKGSQGIAEYANP